MTDEFVKVHNECVMDVLVQITALRVLDSKQGHEPLARDCDDVYEYIKRRLLLEEVE